MWGDVMYVKKEKKWKPRVNVKRASPKKKGERGYRVLGERRGKIV